MFSNKNFKRNPMGGMLEGNSHAQGGIPIEAEGGEIMINTSMNEAADKHKAGLLALNENPDGYMIVDARDRSEIV
tara:strand:- start:932 stop:1156 length:225 start_codon:yes stop_codon:yes gene_type:complete